MCVFGGFAELEIGSLEVVCKLESEGMDELEVSQVRVVLVHIVFCMWLLYTVEPESHPIRVLLFA